MKFKIGDRVTAIAEYQNNSKIIGKSGVITYTNINGIPWKWHTVHWDEPVNGWGEDRRFWDCPESVLEFDRIYQFNSLLDQYYGENKEI